MTEQDNRLPLIEETCHNKGANLSNKIMVFLPGLAQIFQFCEILQRALDLGWTEMLIPLPFHGQSSTECVEAMFAEPAVLASTGKYPLGQNSSICDPDAFQKYAAPLRSSGLHTVPQGLLDHALCAQMLLSRVSLSPM